jgi:hypothetical protein
MNQPLAFLDLPCAPENDLDGRCRENGLKLLTSRDVRENSNARFVRTPIGSGFIALFDPAADEIFSRSLRVRAR